MRRVVEEAKKERKRKLVKDGNNNREKMMKRAKRGEDDAKMEELWETIGGDENVLMLCNFVLQLSIPVAV
ncbi:hypothetical protein Droror1_Dr00002802 [Drosera rotundifolia]